jgi:hypothetical protein
MILGGPVSQRQGALTLIDWSPESIFILATNTFLNFRLLNTSFNRSITKTSLPPDSTSHQYIMADEKWTAAAADLTAVKRLDKVSNFNFGQLFDNLGRDSPMTKNYS